MNKNPPIRNDGRRADIKSAPTAKLTNDITMGDIKMQYPQRKNIRLVGYDYLLPGYYFITICTYQRAHLFGKISVGADFTSARAPKTSPSPEMIFNEIGAMVNNIFLLMQKEITSVRFHEYVIMPNHIHCIIQLLPKTDGPSGNKSLPDIIKIFKGRTAAHYNNWIKRNLFQAEAARLWQRGYYEHIIRDETELFNIAQYIVTNPAKWTNDKYYE
jgi:putative transposase